MRTLLLSTTTGWNCGDDFIRWGVMAALSPDTRVLWWNRGWGIHDEYANSLDVNLPLVDAIVFAGTPEWYDRNERLYDWALEHRTPLYFLGVGKHGGLAGDLSPLRAVQEAGLVRVAIARDAAALDVFDRAGIAAHVLCDPAVFAPPSPAHPNLFVVGWRSLGAAALDRPAPADDTVLTRALLAAWDQADAPKCVVVHDNREVAAAEHLFGAGNVYYTSDPVGMWRFYGRCRYYVGARIHGAVAAVVHGAPAHLLYANDKARCMNVVRDRLGLHGSVLVSFLGEGPVAPRLDLLPPDDIAGRCARELAVFRGHCGEA